MKNICKKCKYFRRHYTKEKKGYYEMSVGHCQYPRIKIKKEEETCDFFELVKKEGA